MIGNSTVAKAAHTEAERKSGPCAFQPAGNFAARRLPVVFGSTASYHIHEEMQ
jgi:hypothetical protein